MKIAIIGVRGIPVVYSGFETVAEQLAIGLSKIGHQLTVYCRQPYIKDHAATYQGINRVIYPVWQNKYLETFFHSFISTLDACFRHHYDLIYYLGAGSAPFILLAKLRGIKTVINVDGLDWKREKWNWPAPVYLKFCERMAVYFADAIITDSKYMRDYYRQQYHKKTHYLTYGYSTVKKGSNKILNQFHIKSGRYFVWTGRLVPENRLEDFLSLQSSYPPFKLVVIGSSYFENQYQKKIGKEYSHFPQIIFCGFVSRAIYRTLLENSLAYIETKQSGGSHPSLIEAMGFGCLIISNNHPANREVLAHSAIYYDRQQPLPSLKKRVNEIINDKFRLKRTRLKKRAFNRVITKYNWKNIILQYQYLFQQILVNRRH